jgi:serine/threonine protein kinase
LGIPYTGAIDLWSLGCMAVEMFLGLPLFPGVSEHDQLRLIEATLGELPQELLRQGRNVLKFYNVRASDNHFVLKTPAEFARDTHSEIQISKKYFKYTKLDDMVHAYPYASHARERHLEKERRDAFLHFVKGLLCVDPRQRWSARDAMQHPFITGEPFGTEHETMPRLLLPAPRPHCCLEYAPQACGELSATPTSTTSCSTMHSESIWGMSGMPPYAPGIRSHYLHEEEEPLTPTGGYYSQDSYHYQPQQYHHHEQPPPQRLQYAAGEKVVPSTAYAPPSSRVYPYDPYQSHDKAYDPYAPFAHYTPGHSKALPTHSVDALPPPSVLTVVSPYGSTPQEHLRHQQQQEYESPYYVSPPPPAPLQHPTGASQHPRWPWGDSAPPPSAPMASSVDDRRSGDGWAQQWESGEVWRREQAIPRHHQYMPELSPANPPPHRRGKRQHTNSWDSGDTRELRRHEAAHPQSGHGPRTGYAHQQAYATPSQHTAGSTGASVGGRVHSAPRKHDHKGGRSVGATTRYPRKSPRGIKPQANHPSPLQPLQMQSSQPRRHDPHMRPLQPHVIASASNREEPTGGYTVEEKFSYVMSLDLPNAAVPLPT